MCRSDLLPSTTHFSFWRTTWEVSFSIFLGSSPLVSFIFRDRDTFASDHLDLVLETLAAQIGFRHVLAQISTSAGEHVIGIECDSVPKDGFQENLPLRSTGVWWRLLLVQTLREGVSSVLLILLCLFLIIELKDQVIGSCSSCTCDHDGLAQMTRSSNAPQGYNLLRKIFCLQLKPPHLSSAIPLALQITLDFNRYSVCKVALVKAIGLKHEKVHIPSIGLFPFTCSSFFPLAKSPRSRARARTCT